LLRHFVHAFSTPCFASSLFGWLMAGAGLFRENSTAGWLRLVAAGWFVLREKYCWLVADKLSEQVAWHSYPWISWKFPFLSGST
jgi:hypothetical protein